MPKPNPPEGFHKLLNSHGYAFQYSVIRLAEKLAAEERSAWLFQGAEFPVVVQGADTRIDFIMSSQSLRTYMVSECKRVNPALGDWCFAQAPYTHRNTQENRLIFDSIEARALQGATARAEGRDYEFTSSVTSIITSQNYHLGFELKSNQRGDPQAGGGIDDAIGQVLRGVNGLINYFASHQRSLRNGFLSHLPIPRQNFTTKIVPVIFTTANLWASDVDLGAADLTTGKITHESVQLTPAPVGCGSITINHRGSSIHLAELTVPQHSSFDG